MPCFDTLYATVSVVDEVEEDGSAADEDHANRAASLSSGLGVRLRTVRRCNRERKERFLAFG